MMNPKNEATLRAALRAHDRGTPFQAESEAALANFRAARAELEAQVRRGDLTPKNARERATAAAEALRSGLSAQAEGYSPAPRAFLDRLVAASQERQKAREGMSLEGLQRETNRLLRLTLVENQLQNRAAEFEAGTFARPVAGGEPAPTLEALLAFHRAAEQSGDEVALEWSRRQLEGFRGRVVEEADVRRIDLACDRPDRINPRLVQIYVDAMAGRPGDELETFVEGAIGDRDANACVAAFVLARQDPTRAGARWIRRVLSGLGEFPDVALTTLRSLEAGARRDEAEAARAHADLAIALAEAEARLEGLEPPSPAELDRAARIQARPVARPGEAIGLNLGRRGAIGDEEYALGESAIIE
jgi:hypothetical protein